MKFWNAGDAADIEKCGCLLVTDEGDVFVAEHEDIVPMMNRLAPDSTKWTTETIQCVQCEATWCEIFKKTARSVKCPDCYAKLKLL